MTAGQRDVRGAGGDAGLSLPELLIALVLMAVTSGLALPTTRQLGDRIRGDHAASAIAGRFRLARFRAISRQANVGIVFDEAAGDWSYRVCVDGNGDGLRRADISAGRDPCPEGPFRLADEVPGARLAVDPSVPPPEGMTPGSSPVRFGASAMATFTPEGTATPGTIFLLSPAGQSFVVRVTGATARTRMLRYDAPRGIWCEDGS